MIYFIFFFIIAVCVLLHSFFTLLLRCYLSRDIAVFVAVFVHSMFFHGRNFSFVVGVARLFHFIYSVRCSLSNAQLYVTVSVSYCFVICCFCLLLGFCHCSHIDSPTSFSFIPVASSRQYSCSPQYTICFASLWIGILPFLLYCSSLNFHFLLHKATLILISSLLLFLFIALIFSPKQVSKQMRSFGMIYVYAHSQFMFANRGLLMLRIYTNMNT